MFTGIVSHLGIIRKTETFEGGRELVIECEFADDTHIDESIAVNGVCLTVVARDQQSFTVQCVDETLRKTILGGLKAGSKVNLERSLTLEKGIEGHFVQGHVDTVGTIQSISKKGADLLLTVRFDEDFSDYVVDRGSIAVDGISLTVARCTNTTCTLAIIPYTWEHTNLFLKSEGDTVNLEFDIFGKYIVRYLNKREGRPSGTDAQ
ncbi:MAG: riboflavin synthase [Balneolaceae bacterium]